MLLLFALGLAGSAVLAHPTAAQEDGAQGAGVVAGVDVPLGGTNEPAITVNPLNANNIVMADLFSLRVSTTNGGAWSAATAPPIPATHLLCGDASLAFDSAGRLFWTYLACFDTNGNGSVDPGENGIDIFIAGVNPATGAILGGYPVNVTASPGVNLPGSAGNSHDKEWLAADRFVGSPFQDRLYIVWTQFAAPTRIMTTFSTDQGTTWSAPLTLSGAGEGFVWPSHNAVAPNGDVYAAYHSQPTFTPAPALDPDGTSGQVFVLRSTDGGVSYPQKTPAFTGGNADITFNVQGNPRVLNQNRSWTQGSAQPWVVPDPIKPNTVSVIAADDPTNTAHGGANDDMAVFIVRSVNSGGVWSAPAQVDSGPGTSHQFFPTASIDYNSQCLTVAWYDSRAGATNAAGNFLLDVFVRGSADGGATFGPEVQLNDAAFDPELGARDRFPPSRTLRIGEYFGVAVINKLAHAVWTGNTTTGQQVLYDNTEACPRGSISGVKFEDRDGDNSDREAGEPGLGGWTIQLRGPVNADAVTAGDGSYSSTDLAPGTYQVTEVTQPPVWTQSYPAGNKHTIVLANQDRTGVNFGNFRQAVIRGTKFLDNNGNSVQEPGEGPVPGWDINLSGTDGTGAKVNLATTTDASGNYEFIVNPGTYTATEKLLPGWVQTAPQPVPPGTHVVTVASGEERDGLDFGNAELGSAAGRKWRDQDADGVQDPNEPGLAGWEIHLDGRTGKGGEVHLVTVTGANGAYIFNNLAPGQYLVSEVLQPGWRQTTPPPPGTYSIVIKSGHDVGGLDFGNQLPLVKAPPLANLWLCNIPNAPGCDNKLSGVEELNLDIILGKAIDSLSPKGEEQSIGSFEFEVRYDAKLVTVDVLAGDLFDDPAVTCSTIRREGSVQFRCITQGKERVVFGPGTLADVRVSATADVYSMLVANQQNGIATQLINQDCQLADLQGHPIKIDACDDAAVTIRYLEGDIHADCVVDVLDSQQLAFRWGSRLGNLLYNSRFDLEPSQPKKGDGDIDAKDLQFVYGRFDSTCKAPHPAQDPVDPKAKPEVTPVTPAPNPALAAAIKAHAGRFSIPRESIVANDKEIAEWPDSCLGLPYEGELCVVVATPGFSIHLKHDGIACSWRTNSDGTNVRLEGCVA
jgi:hypothetical protein